KQDFLKKFGVTATGVGILEQQLMIEDGKIRISGPSPVNPNRHDIGFIDLKTGKTIGLYFRSWEKVSLYFDPVAKLSYAEVLDNDGNKILRKGYINEDGVF